MMKDVQESDMTFQVDDSNTYFIEKSKPVCNKRGLKSVEFVELRKWKKQDVLRFVEAKTTNPNPGNPDPENKKSYDKYIHDIREKFQNSISILFSSLSKREGLEDVYQELPNSIKAIKYQKADCVLWLVVKNSKPEWLIPVMAELKKELAPMLKCWNIQDSNVKVVNEDDARDNKLII
ncbi:MAG: hypothetical protein MJZ81_02315 [Bacteroidales bacterium]|nr:hypothetical protein [Bacteroidales bacterium]